jgi:hypothetical protein
MLNLKDLTGYSQFLAYCKIKKPTYRSATLSQVASQGFAGEIKQSIFKKIVL